MNSEELELSLRAEFESYLKGVLTKVQQDVSDFQRNFEAEFEKHKNQLDEAIRNLSTRFESELDFDRAFTASITEHLRLARDEGATITAEAIGEAEKLKSETEQVVSYDRLRDAIKDITSQTTQSAILKSLVENAGEFAPRGAFFIVKNDHFVGWKVFGKEGTADDAAAQAIHFPVSSDTILAAAAGTLTVKEGNYASHSEDNAFLEPLRFDRPDRMIAIPLIARGRGVAVMYADYGVTGINLSSDALETLVRVAGLTVELLAASNEVKTQQDATPPVSALPTETYRSDSVIEPAHSPDPPAAEPFHETAVAPEDERVEEYTGAVSLESETPAFETVASTDFNFTESTHEGSEVAETESEVTYFEPEEDAQFEHDEAIDNFEEPSVSSIETIDSSLASRPETQHRDWDLPSVAAVPEPAVEEYSVSGNGGGTSVTAVVEPAAVQPVRSRFSERNVDLPIDVPDDERRIHNDARRFARLLVSEIKLYNEQKVADGRESHDLYDRLREAIDRSREMYDKRVQPEVASKFDYFHYELVNGLAEGKDERLGTSYSRTN